jgi:hypothetical protein
VEDGSELVFNRSMESLKDGVGLRLLDGNRYRSTNYITNEYCLKWRSSELTSLIVNHTKRSWIPGKPAVFKSHRNLSACSVINSKVSTNVDQSQRFNLQFPSCDNDQYNRLQRRTTG